MVLRLRLQALEQLCRRCPRVRLERLVLADAHQGIRLFRARGHDTPRPVILERPPHQHLVLPQKGRGQSIALESAKGLSVEGERQRLRSVDQPPPGAQTMAHDGTSHSGRLALIAATMSSGGALTWAT